MRTRPLSEVPPRDLTPLLEEESGHWMDELLWDYSEVSSAVASGLERGALSGHVFEDGCRPVAYCYYMTDAGRAIVGASFASAPFRGLGIEEGLLDAVLADAQREPASERVECQTLFSTASHGDERFARAGFAGRARHYLVRPLDGPVAVPVRPCRPAPGLRGPAPGLRGLRPLRREDLQAAARIVYHSHQGSVDAALNMTYASLVACRGFVDTLVLRAGCGPFESEASFVADGRSGPIGVILASRLSARNGHICQVSVVPEAQDQGVGAALVCAALEAFQRAGLRSASLSVTVANGRAYRLYERLGFRLKKEFAAHAWARPPARIELPA